MIMIILYASDDKMISEFDSCLVTPKTGMIFRLNDGKIRVPPIDNGAIIYRCKYGKYIILWYVQIKINVRIYNFTTNAININK